MTTPNTDANSVLMGGSGPRGWKFEDPGTTHTGTIAQPPKAVQEREYDPQNPGGGKPKTFPSGDPIMGVHVVLQTQERDASDPDDDGLRTFYIEGRYIREAVRDAIRAVGGNGLEVGGQVAVTFTHREDPTDKRSRKFWQVTYTPAGNAALMQPETPAAPVQQPAAPVAPPTPPVAQPVAPQPPAAPPAAAPAPVAAAPDPTQAMAQVQNLIRMGLTDQQIAQAVAGFGLTLDAAAVSAVRAALAVPAG